MKQNIRGYEISGAQNTGENKTEYLSLPVERKELQK